MTGDLDSVKLAIFVTGAWKFLAGDLQLLGGWRISQPAISRLAIS